MNARDAQCLGLFAKYWQAGMVKTRLGKSVGDEQAAIIYRSFLATLIARFQPSSSQDQNGTYHDGVIVYSPENRLEDFQKLVAEICNSTCWQLQPQGDGDLGQRLQRFFASSFRQNRSQVVVIGTDSPTLPQSYMHQAFCLLKSHDAVIGPCDDGGYYLIGMSKPFGEKHAADIFAGIDWSTERVCSQTIRRLQTSNAKFAALPSWYDVDTNEELDRLRQELQRSSMADSAFASLQSVVKASS